MSKIYFESRNKFKCELIEKIKTYLPNKIKKISDGMKMTNVLSLINFDFDKNNKFK